VLRRTASRAVAMRVQEALGEAEVAVADVETDLAKGLLDAHDVDAVEARLFAALLHHADLAEASWTFGRATGDDADRYLQLASGPRGQIAVERPRDGRLITRYRHEEAGGWVMDARPRTPGGGFASADRFRTHFVPMDPTEHPTFTTPASARF